MNKGHEHPLNQFLAKCVKVFQNLGFEVVTGPEIVNEADNFDLLNIPSTHPARDVQDTFWLKDGRLLRTHTSAMQVPAMKTRKPPAKIVVPGRCFRNEATDASHETTFYQLEGFAIDKNITMADLIGTLKYFIGEIFGKEIKIKYSPTHFSFVEPGMEVSIYWKNKWLEILGSGMIHPKVLENMGLDPNEWQGFAFGMGIDRLMMIYYGIDDIRLSYQNDMRFNKQF